MSKIALMTVVAVTALSIMAVSSPALAGQERVTNRCPSSHTQSTVAYHCWSAYPEAFYTTGVTLSTYRVAWKVTCGRRSAHGTSKPMSGAVHLVVNQFTQPVAYKLMITSNVCKIDVVASRTEGIGRIHMGLFINQNHPIPTSN